MTLLSDKTDFQTGSKAEKSRYYIAGARLAVLWERVWRASWPATGIVGAFLAAGLFDIFAYAPAWLHLFLLFLVCLAAGTFLHINLRNFAVPRWEDGARRVEQDSALSHRPLTEGHDRLAVGSGDPWTEELWRAHLRHLLARVTQLRVRWPRPGLQALDPYRLRFAVLGLLALGLLVAGADSFKRIAATLTPDTGMRASLASIDAWINPPDYTGEAPLYLQNPVSDSGSITVPVGSELVLRVHSAQGLPHLALHPDSGVQFKGRSGEFGADIRLTRDADLRAMVDGKLLARLDIKTAADNPPVIAFAQPPAKTERDTTKFSFTAGDDYGVVGARAIIRPIAKDAKAVLSVDLPLASASAKKLSQTVYRDLTAEPLAGLNVEITLEAKDGAGQIGRSKTVRFRLPARIFTNPLSRALVEQRQTLALGVLDARTNVEFALDAITIAPERFFGEHQKAAYLAIRSAYWALKNARDPSDIERVEQILWDTAISLEQGGVLAAADELRRLQEMLSQALEQGAPQDVIQALLDRYRQALQRYLQAMAQNATKQNNTMSANAKAINPQDLDALLKAIEQMAQTGSRSAAAQALALLQNLIENLQMAPGGGKGGGFGTDKAVSDAIQGLGDLIGRQRELLDKSYREGQGAGDPNDGGGKGLAKEQGQLKDDLDKLLKGLGVKAPRTLGDAGKDMGGAQDRLGSNDFDDAGQDQKNALDALRQGAASLAQALMKEIGQSGPPDESDPLGRTGPQNDLDRGWGVRIDRQSLDRARSILEELRRRAAQQGRPQEELDYYDRLLKAF
ncbi:MAG TPA: DUF4175 family protein [Rhizomicrobium sp.]|nr:DUF4175 family protein [Rhizomicrobium sp.]